MTRMGPASHLLVRGLTVSAVVSAAVVSAASASSGSAEGAPAHVPAVAEKLDVQTRAARSDSSPTGDLGVLISAVFADGYAPADADEAVQLWNGGGLAADLSGWLLSDGEGSAGFPPGAVLAPGGRWWIARTAAAFQDSYGHPPDWAWAGSAGGAPEMTTTGGGPSLANNGDEVMLLDWAGGLRDVVVYGDREAVPGWNGPPVVPYRTSSITARNQVMYRKLDVRTAAPIGDTDGVVDWASDANDPVLGRRVRFPGWDLEDNLLPSTLEGTGNLEVVLAPDALFSFIGRHLAAATQSVDLFAYTLDNPGIAEILAQLARRGVRVRLLLDGSPAGGFDGNARWCAALVASAGGQVYWMAEAGGVRPRYASAHAKLILVDDRTLLVGTENPGLGAAPYDDTGDGTSGRRGAAMATDLPAAAIWARGLIDRDLDVAHTDVRPYQERDPVRGAPAPDFEPARTGGGTGYRPIAAIPFASRGPLSIAAITAPEQAPHPSLGMGSLVDRAGFGDRLDVVQLKEPLWWGRGGDVAPEISPRLVAYRAAARRGAHVRVLLDGYFEDPGDANGNRAAANWLNRAASQETLRLEGRLGNPTGLGIHAKLAVLRPAAIRGSGWVHLGSLNGTEISSKANREVALHIRSSEAAAYLGDVIDRDWLYGTYGTVLLPMLPAFSGGPR